MQPPIQTELETSTRHLPSLVDSTQPARCKKGVERDVAPEAATEPPVKKLRLDDTDYIGRHWKLRAVLGSEALFPVPLVSAVAAQIKDKKETSKLIRQLNEVLPITSLQHLKRVKSVKEAESTSIRLLLWQHEADTCDIDSNLVKQKLEAVGVDASALFSHFGLEAVAKFAPLTRSQFEDLKSHPSSYWPCNFHEDKYFESLVTSSHELWTEENRCLQEQYMRRAHGISSSGGGVVVDPSSNTVVAEGHGTGGHPLHHTVINLVDLVARSQGGGALEHTSRLSTLKYNEDLAAKYKMNGRSGREGENCDSEERPTTSHNHLKRFGSIAQLSTVPKTGPYLCTGYDVYLSCEPCHLCSMALIHMRTRRVFYSRPSRDGALGSNDKIHTLTGLNHRYEVFTGILDYNTTDTMSDCC